MYVTGPPDDRPTAGANGAELKLAAVHHRVFADEGRGTEEDREYFRDLFASFGRKAAEDALAGRRTAFRAMVAAMLPDVPELAAGFDLAVLTHATPDSEPGFPLSVLSQAVPSPGLAYGLSDLGATGPFAALAMVLDGIHGSVHDGPVRRAAVWIMEQSATWHDEPIPDHARADRDSAVVLVLDTVGGFGSVRSARHLVCRSVEQIRTELDAALAGLSGEAVTVLCGKGLSPLLEGWAPGRDVRAAPPGLLATGPWSLLAAIRDASSSSRHSVLLADYDQELGYLGLCAVDLTADGAPVPVLPDTTGPTTD